MAYRKRATVTPDDQSDKPERLSQNGHLLGIGIYGALVLVGFMFGIVTGYERPRPVAVAKATKDTPTPTPAKGSPKVTPEPGPTPTPSVPKDVTSTKTEPKPKDDTSTKIEPKPKDTTPPKKDTTVPKKDDMTMVTTKPVSFQKDVLPIFRSYCLNCHGAAGAPKGDVDLRTIASIKRGGGGPILEIGKPDKSAIYTTVQDGSMPPNGKKPTKGEVDVIKNWILTGANPRRAIRNRHHRGRR